MNLQAIEQEIQSIPGNGPVLEELYKLLESGEAIALVGAGASAGLWPLWSELLKGLVEFSQKHGKINAAEFDFFLQQVPRTPLETAQQLRNKIGERDYFEYLQDTFSDKVSPHTTGAFTPAHHALMQLPIHNYVTTNYDAGLTNARASLYPKATTSYFFWDQEEARRIFDLNYKRLVLHAHGRHDRADSIILTQADYGRVYDNRAFVRLLESLFAYKNLLIVGFSMSDPYIEPLFRSISEDNKKSPLHHIAFIGIEDKGLPAISELRKLKEKEFYSRILFYPIRNHHQTLTDWLTLLAEKYATATGSQTAEEIQPFATPPQLKTALPDKYIHQPTDDANFKGRTQDFATLNRWANDPATRMIAITGIGGQGKTALVGRWLKQERTQELARMPVFFWSFYEDLDVGKFVQALVDFVKPMAQTKSKGDSEALTLLLEVLKELRVLVILDGLEVLQEEASSPAHGRINHPLLEQLLQVWLRYPHQSLMILTSRFQFPQLARFTGVGFHHLNLIRLSHDDGLSLLLQLGVWGNDRLMGDYVEKLHGHPLALRVLASTVKRECLGEIDKFSGKAILAGGDADPLSQKLERLLGFYERQLKNGQKELLGIISLFRRPVEMKSLVTLLGNMKSLQNTPLVKANAAEIEKQLNLLIDDFLVEKTHASITTHPVIRDYFRKENKITGSRREVADFLEVRPGKFIPRNIEEVRDLVEAVQLLCDEGEFKAADDLLSLRLATRGYGFNIFRDLPAVAEGLECVLAFVGDEMRMQKVERVLGKSSVAGHCSGVALCNDLLGNLPHALEWWYKCVEINLQLKQMPFQPLLHEISTIEIALGNIRQAREIVLQALRLSLETQDLWHLHLGFAYKAYHEFLLGNSSQAYQGFDIALYYEQKDDPDQQHLHSDEGIQQVEFFIRLRGWKSFEAVNAWNIQKSKEFQTNQTLALCYMFQGWYEIYRGQLSQAEKELTQAERILRPSGIVEKICRLDWVWALLAEAKGEYEKGLQRVNDALFTAADKGFRLWQADLLVLRGRLRLQQFRSPALWADVETKESGITTVPHKSSPHPLWATVNAGAPVDATVPHKGAGLPNIDLLEQAGDDGHEALKIAEQTGYIWPKVEALELLAAYHQTRATLPAFNSQDEKDKAQSYAKEAASIKKGLFLTEEQMQELKAQARQEFEKQVAGWDAR